MADIYQTLISRRATWVALFVVAYAILLSSSWSLLRSILTWYQQNSQNDPASSSAKWPAVYVAVTFGCVFGVISMAAALAVAIPAMVVTWITVLVLLAWKPRSVLVVEGRKITKEITGFALKILLREGNGVAAVCAVVSYFVLVGREN
ncbi:uncharacterized protein LOC18442052 [Amborella trichopoda]|uniref:Pyrroline-5-carboxylate reductase n=1 Tax=Amborella trichopoda TaxID=13333 RepID=W1Q0W9_AMBTC|nr:uncharacterized protein LOC18442052 [Amborella trichopoda]ERN13805.1 hypothetical protein AMTR_s00049p00210480 [Amborella trichopoda]|eukprot:XP_011626185.1 uncharacterized protein LOC18442052 [Amborella trichopoda]